MMVIQRNVPGILWLAAALLVLLAKAGAAESWEAQQELMIERHLRGRDIHDTAVLKAMKQVKRHRFVPDRVEAHAYADRPLPIGEGQTISQPYIVALMSQLLQVTPGMSVLEVGTGSGYQAAVLQAMGAEVYSIEIIPALAERTKRLFSDMKLPIQVRNADGYFGWPDAAPFDRIIITAAANHVPRPLLKQLKRGGRLILPLGNIRLYQVLTVIAKTTDGKTSVSEHGGVRFVPMTGRMLEP